METIPYTILLAESTLPTDLSMMESILLTVLLINIISSIAASIMESITTKALADSEYSIYSYSWGSTGKLYITWLYVSPASRIKVR